MSLRGEFTPPGDKAISHRIVLAAILAEGEVNVSGLCDCGDLKSSLSVFKTLGGEIMGGGENYIIKGLGGCLALSPDKTTEIDCGNSGTAMRLTSGILAGLSGRFIIDGGQQLRRRPMERLADPLRQMGAHISTTDGRAPLSIQGSPLHGIEYINSDSSAQLKNAVTLATISAKSSSKIIEPYPTRDHMERLLSLFGAKIISSGGNIEIFPGRLTFPPEISVPGDPSAAAFFLIGAAMIPGSSVTARNILLSTERIGFLKILDRMGASISISMDQEKPVPRGMIQVKYSGQLKAATISREEIPSIIDEIPMLALAAASAEGVTVFQQVRELRLKETDRLTAIKHQLGAIGVRVKVEKDDLFIEGPTRSFQPEALDSGYDHQLAMMLHMAAVASGSNAPVLGDESISASYPCFKDDLKRLTEKKAEVSSPRLEPSLKTNSA